MYGNMMVNYDIVWNSNEIGVKEKNTICFKKKLGKMNKIKCIFCKGQLVVDFV